MKVKIETKFLKNVIKAISISDMIDAPTIVFKQGGMEAQNKDISQTVMSVCDVSKNNFEEYTINGEEERVTIEIDKTIKLLKNINGDIVTIERVGNSLSLMTDKEKIKIPLMDYGKKKDINKTFKINENGTLPIIDETYYLNEIIPLFTKDLSVLNEMDSKLTLKNGTLSLVQQTVDEYNFEKVIATDLNSKDFVIYFDNTFLKKLFDSTIGEDVVFHLGKDKPLVLEEKSTGFQLFLLLAPRIVEE